MKKLALSAFAFSALLCGCFFEDSSKKSYNENIINVDNTGTYSMPQEFQKKDAYLVCYNDSEFEKDSSKDSYFCEESEYSTQIAAENSFRSTNIIENEEKNEEKAESFLNRPKRIDYIQEPFDFKLVPASEARTVSGSLPDYTGDTADFFLDDKYDYKKVKATKKEDGKHCRVWYYKDSSIENPSDSIFKELADWFDKIFEKETELLCSNVPTRNYQNIISVSESTKINILVYDIFDDYEETVKNNGGTYGFFAPKDMYSETKEEIYSNKCEMFYIDTYFLTEKDSNGNKVLSHTMVSTLAHEFQHMLGFIQKGLNYNSREGSGETWYTEMLSMLTEEFFVEYLEIEKEAGPQARIPHYLSGNRYGFSNWRNSDSIVYNNYANAYAFGAYLTRNFGGIELVQRIFRNRYTDEQSIVSAVKDGGYDYDDFSELLALFSAVQIYTSDSNHISLNKSGKKDIFSYPKVNLSGFYSILLPKKNEDEFNSILDRIYPVQDINEKSSFTTNDGSEYLTYKGPIYYRQNPNIKIDYTGSFIVHLGNINEFTIKNKSGLKYYILFK